MKAYITALIVGCTIVANAQDINTQIQVDRTIQPQEREAVRPSTFEPTVQLPAVQLKPLTLHEYLRASELTTYTPLLEPVAYGDTIVVTPYRGYATIGYFPAYNLGASAGYRFINNNSTRLGARLQFDGMSYKGFDSTTDQTFSSNTLNVGADFNHKFGSLRPYGLLSVSLDYKYARLGIPSAGDNYTRSVNAFDASAVWRGFIRWSGSYHAGLSFSRFGFSKGNPEISPVISGPFDGPFDGAGENRLKGHLGVSFGNLKKGFMGGVEVDADFLHNTSGLDFGLYDGGSPGYGLYKPCWSTLGIIGITPYYSFKNDHITGHIGLRADITTGNSGKHFHVAPEVTLGFTPTSTFAVEARFTGGEHINALSELYDLNQWISPLQVYDRSNVPVDGRLTVAFGPFSGVTIKLYGGFCMANDWLINRYIPERAGLDNSNSAWQNILAPVNIKGWIAGANIGYRWRDYVEFEAEGAITPQSFNKGYYLWRDHARYVIESHVTIHPVKPLDITVGYQFRGGRRSYAIWATDYTNLGNISSLDLGASYRISDPFTVGFKLENLLNRRYSQLIGIPAQGFKGLVGISYKF